MNRTADQLQLGPVPIILRDAARYLAHSGWFQGAKYDPDDKVECPAACTWGAIYIAVTGRHHGASPAEWDDINEATNALAQHLGKPGAWDQPEDAIAFVTDWNDESERTFEEVITGLDEAAIAYIERVRATAGDAR